MMRKFLAAAAVCVVMLGGMTGEAFASEAVNETPAIINDSDAIIQGAGAWTHFRDKLFGRRRHHHHNEPVYYGSRHGHHPPPPPSPHYGRDRHGRPIRYSPPHRRH